MSSLPYLLLYEGLVSALPLALPNGSAVYQLWSKWQVSVESQGAILCELGLGSREGGDTGSSRPLVVVTGEGEVLHYDIDLALADGPDAASSCRLRSRNAPKP